MSRHKRQFRRSAPRTESERVPEVEVNERSAAAKYSCESSPRLVVTTDLDNQRLALGKIERLAQLGGQTVMLVGRAHDQSAVVNGPLAVVPARFLESQTDVRIFGETP